LAITQVVRFTAGYFVLFIFHQSNLEP